MRRRPMRYPHSILALCVAAVAALPLLLAVPGSAAVTDDTQPIVTYTLNGIAGTNGWYRGSSSGNFITVNWSVSDPDGPILSTTGCEPGDRINGPNKGTTRTCSATSDGGTTTVTTKKSTIAQSTRLIR